MQEETTKIRTVQRVDLIREKAASKSVLHLGCTNYPYTQDSIEKNMLLHLDLQKTASELYGFDFDQEGIDTLAAAGVPNLYRADLEQLDQVELDRKFDVIIAGEMIEHLLNPGLFLNGIKRFMHPGTELVITTVNAYAAVRMFPYALRGKGGVNEPVHPDHVAYYSYKTLSKLVQNAGFDVADFMFYDVGHEHRPTLAWYYRLMNDLSVAIFPQLSDGVIAVCKLKS